MMNVPASLGFKGRGGAGVADAGGREQAPPHGEVWRLATVQ